MKPLATIYIVFVLKFIYEDNNNLFPVVVCDFNTPSSAESVLLSCINEKLANFAAGKMFGPEKVFLEVALVFLVPYAQFIFNLKYFSRNFNQVNLDFISCMCQHIKHPSKP